MDHSPAWKMMLLSKGWIDTIYDHPTHENMLIFLFIPWVSSFWISLDYFRQNYFFNPIRSWHYFTKARKKSGRHMSALWWYCFQKVHIKRFWYSWSHLSFSPLNCQIYLKYSTSSAISLILSDLDPTLEEQEKYEGRPSPMLTINLFFQTILAYFLEPFYSFFFSFLLHV